MFPEFARLLNEAEILRTHQASLELLDQVGLEVNHATARELYRRHGCRVDEDNLRVTMPPAIVEEFMQLVPARFTFRARNPDFDRSIPDDAPLTMTASSAPNIIDPVTHRSRRANSQDIARIARLVNRLDGVDLFSVPVLAADAPSGQYSLTRFYTALKNCEKPVRGSGDPGIDSDAILRLAFTIAGSEGAYRDHPFITHHYCPIISPLKMDNNSTEMLIFYTEQGLPSHPTVVPNGGLTAPITLAGTLVQGNAEFLALAILTQMVRPGTPTIYSSLSTVGDMRSGAYVPGGIECGMLNMAHAQMARYYQVPSAGYIGLTNSKLVDVQAGYEKAMSCMGGLLAGMHVLQFVGLIESLLAFDYGMAVVDNEIAMMLKRMFRGLEFSEDNLALKEIGEVGPGGMFLTTERTLANMASVAFFPSVADRETRPMWEKAGAKDAYSRSLQKAKEIIQEHGPELLDPEVDRKVHEMEAGMVAGDFSIPEGW